MLCILPHKLLILLFSIDFLRKAGQFLRYPGTKLYLKAYAILVSSPIKILKSDKKIQTFTTFSERPFINKQFPSTAIIFK